MEYLAFFPQNWKVIGNKGYLHGTYIGKRQDIGKLGGEKGEWEKKRIKRAAGDAAKRKESSIGFAGVFKLP